MNILTDRLPESVEIEGTKYDINTDFRAFVRIETIMQDREASDEDKRINAMLAFLTLESTERIKPEHIAELEKKLIWFYLCGKDPEQKKGGNGKKHLQSYSFAHDSDYIYAAFMTQYGVDLAEVKLHWWKFRAMFDGLNEDLLFSKIQFYRTVEIKDSLDKETKTFYRKMKKAYKLPDDVSATEADKLKLIEEQLAAGGTVNPELLK